MMETSITPEKAYNKGCMWGMSGGTHHDCPYKDSALADRWQAGWKTGSQAFTKTHSDKKAAQL